LLMAVAVAVQFVLSMPAAVQLLVNAVDKALALVSSTRGAANPLAKVRQALHTVQGSASHVPGVKQSSTPFWQMHCCWLEVVILQNAPRAVQSVLALQLLASVAASDGVLVLGSCGPPVVPSVVHRSGTLVVTLNLRAMQSSAEAALHKPMSLTSSPGRRAVAGVRASWLDTSLHWSP
jgi:hypothetical protein